MKSKLIIFTFCLVLFGCAKQVPVEFSPGETIQSNLTQRTIAHAMGVTAVPNEPQRIVVLTNEATDMVLALGVTPVGAVKSWSGDPYYEYLAKDMLGVPIVGDEMQPNLEKIVALQPDLIIGSRLRQGQIYKSLSAIAPTVFSETIGESWQDNLRLYGQALDREAEAEQLLNDWDTRVAQMRQKLSAKDLTISLVRFMPRGARIYLQNSFPGQILQAVGLERPASQANHGFAEHVSFEQIPQMEADALFYFIYTGDSGDQTPGSITNPWLNHPLWQQLEVVQSGKAYAVSDVVWTTAGGIQAAHLLLDDLERHLEP
ncbi:iron(III) dicitrate transport system permease protein; FecB [Synechocystis sp. PCC 6803]|uniref:Iron(III) dicitrate transport system permease protein FecB n=1 Tax=Synechocystis sp. (strain ATCC 27184 / PCC 6803 / Kazusa) TaxID=1111708 RepID=P72593_SYNY3|nr:MULTISPECIES: iron-siderophore ABC transporter substrate-binding protein [unclassified Synechocystis]BAM50290.1 iron(III) dicitrate ABC transporter permease [Synechocystis sp. PCC 6803] [Bacillus subtilis BEST7613]AGF50282.1 iron(III) dicitrate transport system permease protein FecB [Synechocystis sp. PCC 6803]ALJ66383.1 iron siderophore-binding protein [Synechocystis sp. PCC 6803]AVP88229.1 iron-siderophore ABC transporter substrate-binding protein [Synechocystis sp. IPPAS B-1465]MBD261960